MNRRTEVLVGSVILLGAAVVVLGTVYLKGTTLGQEERVVQARFREVGHLLVGNEVKLRGVPIGRVDEIALEPSGEGVVVSLTVRGDVALPADPVVILSPESMFGDWQAEIFARTQFPGYRYAESPDPQVLPGYSLPDMSRLTAVADRIAENLAVLTDRIGVAFTEETAHNIREAIENIQEVSEQLTGLVATQQRTVEEVAQNLQSTTETLGQAAETVQRTFAQVEGAIAEGELEAIVDNIERASGQIDSLSAALLSASRDLQTTAASADTTFRLVTDVATRMRGGEGTLGQLLQDTLLYVQLVQTNRQLQALINDIKANPRKYIRLEIF